MFIDLEDNQLKIVDDDSLLSPSDVFQLKHWGFQKNGNTYLAKDYDLIKIIKFLEESYQDCSISKNVES